MEGEPTTHTFQVVDRPPEIAQPTPIPLVTPIVAQPDSGNAAALVEQAETLLKETKSLLLETASLLKERTDATKTAEPDGNGASDHAVEDLMDAAAQLEERTEALRAEPELQDQAVEELPAEPIVEPEPAEPESADLPLWDWSLSWARTGPVSSGRQRAALASSVDAGQTCVAPSAV